MAIKTETIAIKVSPEEKKQIQELAAKEDITVSKLLHKKIFNKESVKMSIDEMMNELKHYTNADLRERTVNEICEMYYELFKGEN